MRDIVLIAAFTCVLPFALRRTWVAVMLWTWVSVMNPHKLAWGFALNFPFAAVAAGAALVSMLWDSKSLRFPRDASITTLMLFVGWMCITTLFAFYLEPSLTQLNKVAKIQLMTLVAAAAIRERRHIELFVWINALSIAFYGTKGGVFTITSGGAERVWGPSGGFIEGNNEIGLAIIMVIPLLNYLRMVSPRAWVRSGLLVIMLLCAVAAVGTQSRGAFLAIMAMALVLWTRSSRKLTSAVVLVLCGIALLALMPDTWQQRMGTIQEYEKDSSAMGRINAWRMAFNLANDRVLGGGFEIYLPGVFARYAPVPEDIHAAHSIYFQVLGEHGWIGMTLFLLVGAFSLRTAAQLRKQTLAQPETLWVYHLTGMIQVSMAGYAVGGAFLSLAYFDLPYNILVMLVACRTWMAEERWRNETVGAFGARVPVGRLSQKPTSLHVT
jgi:putative inorganic carbon (HCO3(-)) transporter